MAIQAQDNSYLLMDNALCFVSQEQLLMRRVQPEQALAFPQTLSAHAEALDMYINSQNERLRTALQEQRKQHVSALTKRYESRVRFLIAQKEMEIDKASRRSAELRGFLRRMESESQNWQRVARENESMAASLTQRLREAAAAEDAESCCGSGEKKVGKSMACKCCSGRESRVVMLPCRHLCSCRECDAFLDSCPVCKAVKKASVEAFI